MFIKKYILLFILSCLFFSGCGGGESSTPDVVDSCAIRDQAKPLQTGVLVLTFDDHFIEDWQRALPLLERYNAKATFFVTLYKKYVLCTDCPWRIKYLNQIATKGHEIAYHGLNHLNAVDYVKQHDLSMYINDEILPGVKLMMLDGFDVKTFALPYGATTPEINQALLKIFEKVRTFSIDDNRYAEAISDGSCRVQQGASMDYRYLDMNHIYDAIDKANKERKYLILSSHKIRPSCDLESNRWCITTKDLESILDYADASGMKFDTFGAVNR